MMRDVDRECLPKEVSHFCRGCGSKLPVDFRGLFHKQCLCADKRLRVSKQRRREQDRFKQLLEKQHCLNCGTRYGEQRSDGATEASCEASRPTQNRDPTVG
jgi:hypothetical protein